MAQNACSGGHGDRGWVPGPATRCRRSLTTGVAALLGIAGLVVLACAAPGADAASAGAGAARSSAQASGLANVAVLDVVMLVDESGSETPAKVADEKQTVSTIVQSMLNPRSRVTVVGFGGINHVAPHQTPVDIACVPTIASGQQNLSYLASCVSKLHRRTETEGDDTDYAAALGQAMSYLSPDSTATPPSPPGAIKIILMMTDGAVDVHRDTQQYGANWQEGEKVAIDSQLSLAKKSGVQVWPLGFGTDVGTGLTVPQALAYLNNIAAGGASAVCDKQHTVNQPHATWVNNPENAISALNELYADASCLGTNGNSTTVSGGGSSTLSVAIPQIASDAAISVDRVSPNITVGFTMPDGRAWTDATAISGQDNSPVVVLHLTSITSADVGTWKIKLTAPPGQASQLVSATAFWQGAVRAVITANPPSAKLGQPINVELDVLGPSGPITDQSALNNLLAGVTVTGDNLPGTSTVKVSPASSPGEFTGTFKAPAQAGTLTFTGSASGYGLYSTDVPTYVAVGTANPNFTATAEFPVVTKVQIGDAITGNLIFTNKTGSAKQVRLLLSTSGASASITSPAGAVSAPSGNPPTVPFTVQIAKNSRTGAAWLRVEVVDASNPRLVYNAARIEVTVTKPPTFLQKYFWEIIGLIILIALIIVAILWRRAVIRRRKDVRGLTAILRREGQELGQLRAKSAWSDTFSFVLRDEDEQAPRLEYEQPGFSVYQVKRAAVGQVQLMTPARAKPYDVTINGEGQAINDDGLELAFRDSRRRQVGGVPSGRKPRPMPSATGTSGSPVGSGIPSGPPAQEKDPWL